MKYRQSASTGARGTELHPFFFWKLSFYIFILDKISLTLVLHCPRLCCHSFCYSMWSFWVAANLCSVFFLSFVNICIAIWDPTIERGGSGSRSYLIGLTPLHLCACPKAGPRCSTSYFVVFLCSVSWGERWLFVLLILVELLTITV